MKTINKLLVFILIGLILTSCSAGGSSSSSLSTSQQFAANVTNKSLTLNQQHQTLSAVAFSSAIESTTALPQAYLLTTSNSYTNKLYSYNQGTWQENPITAFESNFVPNSMVAANGGLYINGTAEGTSQNSNIRLYFYANNMMQSVESIPFTQYCTNYCQIQALTPNNDGSAIYVAGVDDRGVELYLFNGNTWSQLPPMPGATESIAVPPNGQMMYTLHINALTTDKNNNLYAGGRVGTLKGPYVGYYSKYVNNIWSQEQVPDSLYNSLSGVVKINDLLYLSGINNLGSPTTSYSILKTTNNLIGQEQIYHYEYSSTTEYANLSSIYTDIYGNIYIFADNHNGSLLLIGRW